MKCAFELIAMKAAAITIEAKKREAEYNEAKQNTIDFCETVIAEALEQSAMDPNNKEIVALAVIKILPKDIDGRIYFHRVKKLPDNPSKRMEDISKKYSYDYLLEYLNAACLTTETKPRSYIDRYGKLNDCELLSVMVPME